MKLKLAGAALLMCSGGLWCTVQIRRWREEIQLLRELGAALERMEGMIRWQNLSLPKILERESQRFPCGIYFREIAAAVEQEKPLQLCWTEFWSGAEWQAVKEIMSAVELGGDSQQIMGALHLSAQMLYRKSEELQQTQQRKERLCITASTALTAMIAIILI